MSNTPERNLEFDLTVAYSQVCIFDSDLENPFNAWTDGHVGQGFSWRPGSACFRTLEDAGLVKVVVRISDHATIKDEAIRATEVPFTVPDSGRVEVAGIGDSRLLDANPGGYSLIFETGYDENQGVWCWFSLVATPTSEAKILKADGDLNPPASLIMSAEPA